MRLVVVLLQQVAAEIAIALASRSIFFIDRNIINSNFRQICWVDHNSGIYFTN